MCPANRVQSKFKTKVVLEVLREKLTVNEIASKHELNPVMISRWKAEMVFGQGTNEVEKVKKEYESKQENLEQLDMAIKCHKSLNKQL